MEISIEFDGNNGVDVYLNGEFALSGYLRQSHSGRESLFTFEPAWFATPDAERLYGENWESIDDRVAEAVIAGSRW